MKKKLAENANSRLSENPKKQQAASSAKQTKVLYANDGGEGDSTSHDTERLNNINSIWRQRYTVIRCSWLSFFCSSAQVGHKMSLFCYLASLSPFRRRCLGVIKPLTEN